MEINPGNTSLCGKQASQSSIWYKNSTDLLILLLGFGTLILWFLLYWNGAIWTAPGDLAGSDGYMRLNRVVQLYESGHCYDNVSSRSNAPFGETLHWTRPLDLLLLAGAWLLSPLLGFASALFWWGVMISPVLQVLSMFALVWAVGPMLDRKGLLYLAVIFLCQSYSTVIFQAGRPDHHSLLLFVFAISLGFTLRLLLLPFRLGYAYGAGAVSALSVWISVESLLPLAINLGALSLGWVSARREFSRKNLHFCLALVGATCIALLLEQPWPWLLRVEYDRLSIFHLFLFALLALLWLALWRLDHRGQLCSRVGARLAVGAAGGVLLLCAVWLTFPKFLLGPFADLDPRIVPIWLSKVGEVAPLISLQEGLTPEVMMNLFPAAAGLLFALYLIFAERQGEYTPWLYIFGSLLVFTLATQDQERWIAYAEILFAVAAAEFLSRSLNRLDLHLSKHLQPLVHFLLVSLICFSMFNLGTILQPFFPRQAQTRPNLNVPLARLSKYLNEVTADGPPRRILTHVFSGPEIIYRTRHEVIATPYHRNAAGILYAYEVMTAPTPEVAERLLRERHVDLIILCLETNEAEIFSRQGVESTFYQRLRRGDALNWLKPLTLPADLASSFQVFEVLP